MNEKECVLAFSLYDKFGYKTIKRIQEIFGSLEKAIVSKEMGLWMEVGLKSEVLAGWFDFSAKNDLDGYLNKLNEEAIKYVTFVDEEYPERLKNIFGPPAIMYYRGDISLINSKCMAVVGTRGCTSYGKRATAVLVKDMVQQGLVIVSGLALGIDSIAHQTTLDNNGKTIAVLGGGLDEIYPSVNRKVADKIVIEGGLVMSEMRMGTIPARWHFPARNRIVAGISDGVLVIEAPKKSGALITAKMALDGGKSVMVVPGDIFNTKSFGSNKLIGDGATIINESADIFFELGLEGGARQKDENIETENELQAQVVEKLKGGEKYFDELVMCLKVDSNILISEMNMMVLNGVLMESGGGKWSLVP